jgi:hypothetical protein
VRTHFSARLYSKMLDYAGKPLAYLALSFKICRNKLECLFFCKFFRLIALFTSNASSLPIAWALEGGST